MAEYDPPELTVTQSGADVLLEWVDALMPEATHFLVFRRNEIDDAPLDPLADHRIAKLPRSQLSYLDVDPGEGAYSYQVFPAYSSSDQ